LPTELLNKFEGLYKSETKGMTAQTPRRRFSRWLLVLPLLLVAVALAAAIFVTEWYRGQQIEQRRLEARAATATGNYSDYRAALDVYDELLATDPEGGDILAEAARLHAMTALLFGTEDDGRAEKLIGRGKELSIRTGALSPARAAVHLHRGEYDLADKVLNATQRSTGDIAPELIYLRGRWYLSQDNPPEALRRFVAAAEANPDDARLVLAQAEALVAQGSHQDALEKLDHIQQRVEKSVAARLLRAKINIQTGRYPEGGERTAREVLDELAPRAAPGQLAWANLLRARYMVLTEKTVQATKLAAEAQQQQPARDAEFAALLARTLLDVGDATSAIGEADAAVDLAPHLSRYRLLLGEAHLEAGQIDQAEELLKALPPSPKAALLSGRIAHLRGDLDRAQDYFDEAARGEREAPTAKLYIAKILLAKGESREAIRLLTHLSIRPPALPEAHTLLGEAHLSTGDVEAAHQALQIAAEQLPHNPMVRVWIGRVHLSKGEMSLARSAANEALDLEPGYPDGLALVGRILFEEGKLTQAQTAFTTARRSQEDHPEALIGLARVSAERRDFAQAESFLAQLGAQAPQGLLELARGEISLRQYDGSGAISHLRRATKHLPADPLPRSLLGDAYVMRGDRASRTRARREYRASLKMNRDYSRALVGLAELSLLGWSVKAAENALDDIKGLLKQPRVSPALKARIHTALGRFQFELKGNPAAAQEPLKKALKLDPNLAEAHLASGFANQDLGQQRDACTHFRRYLKLAPDGPRADLAEARRGVKFNCQ
jgi:predicted Zn-dependent protease